MKIPETKFYNEIIIILENARNKAYREVNKAMISAYWLVGKRIVEEEQKGKRKADYGEHILEELAKKLTEIFGKGFNLTNLRYMRQFYLTFQIHHAVSDEFEKFPDSHHSLRDELSWTHYRLLIKVENSTARNYYMNEAADQGWSTRMLERQINTLYFERLLSSKNKKPLLEKTIKDTAADMPVILDYVKDPYILEFLNIRQPDTLFEKDIETGLLNKIQHFLLELGRGFSFVARQKKIAADNECFYVDLVFYNYILKCFVLIELKVGKLTHQDIGQMDFYVRYYEDQIKQSTDNPTIGIILCTEKNEAVIKYSVLNESKQLFASRYKLYLPTEQELKRELERGIAIYSAKKEE